MSNDLQAFALKTAFAEIKNTCPDVSNTFIFTDNGDLLAKDEETEEQTRLGKDDGEHAHITERLDNPDRIEKRHMTFLCKCDNKQTGQSPL